MGYRRKVLVEGCEAVSLVATMLSLPRRSTGEGTAGLVVMLSAKILFQRFREGRNPQFELRQPSVAEGLQPELKIGPAQRLFSDPVMLDFGWSYDVSADGRFVMVEDVAVEKSETRKPAIRITQNWYEEFRDRMLAS